MTGFVVVSRGRSDCSGACYSATGTPEGVVVFPTRAAARAKLREIAPDTPSKYMPMVVAPAFTDADGRVRA